MKTKLTLVLLFSAVFTAIAYGINYNDVMNKKVKAVLGNEFKDYQSFSFPTDNFGLITAYTPKDNTDKPKDKDFLCDTWECLNMANNIPTDPELIKNINGFAAVGENGADITLTVSEKSDIAFNALLPKIASILSIGGGFDKNKNVVTELQAGPFFVRKLRRQRMTDFINGLPPTSAMKRAFDQGKLVLVVGDVVSTGMKVRVKADSNTKANIDAKIGAPGGTGVVSKVFTDSSFGFKVTREENGEYTFQTTRPVVVLRLAKHQPASGILEANADDDWKDWVPVQKMPKPKKQ